MATKPYAEIVIDVQVRKLDRIFHYRVPSGMRERLETGMKVVVPFGTRTVEGYVLGFCDIPEVTGIKDITDIIEEEPGLNPDLLALAGWMSERYLCSTVDAIRAIVPAGARTVGYRYIIPVEGPLLSSAEESLNILEKEIYNYIKEHGKTLYTDIRSRFDEHKSGAVVRKLSHLGLVEVLREVKSKVRPRFIRTVDLAVSCGELDHLTGKLEKKAPRQAAVLRAVQENRGLPVAELAALAGTTPSTVRDMVKKGYLKSEDKEIRRDPYAFRAFARTEALSPTAEQLKALTEIRAAIDRRDRKAFLIHGVTGSGKTEVYLQAIAYCLEKGRQAIALVPEISLTPQMVERFKGRFGDLVAVIHSGLSMGERYDEWRRVKNGRVKVVVGARSAVFAPFSDPGLFIIDEEHEISYKQEDNPKYHAREVAMARAHLSGSAVVMGSATPSLESYSRAIAGKYRLLTLDRRVQGRSMPRVDIIDLRDEMHAGHRSIFSRRLIEKMERTLKRGEQAILFLNRRGYSTFVVCRDCGLVMKCPKCSISLTLHARENLLRCHYCDFTRKSPDLCPKCQSGSIRKFGIGTQKVEEEVARWFPEARIARMDMDTTAGKGSHEKILNMLKEGKTDILVGTQMIAKGLDFPGVTLVGVITADTSLNLPDFRSAERTFQLLTQVAGRAGRGQVPGEVIIQTYSPDHYSVTKARDHDYLSFYREEIRVRGELEYPPYCSLVRIVIYGLEENSVIRSAEILAGQLRKRVGGHNLGVTEPLLGPAPAPINRLRNRFRWQICLRGKPASLIRDIVWGAVKSTEKDSYFASVGVSIDVDPLGLM